MIARSNTRLERTSGEFDAEAAAPRFTGRSAAQSLGMVALEGEMVRKNRSQIPISRQVEVLFRDRWLCSLCHRPTIFPPAMKYLAHLVREAGYELPIAYYDFRYRRDAAPLLDDLACVIDHVNAHSRGGADDLANLAVACNKSTSSRAMPRRPPIYGPIHRNASGVSTVSRHTGTAWYRCSSSSVARRRSV